MCCGRLAAGLIIKEAEPVTVREGRRTTTVLLYLVGDGLNGVDQVRRSMDGGGLQQCHDKLIASVRLSSGICYSDLPTEF